MQSIIAWARSRVLGNWRTSAAGVGLLCAGLGLIFGAEAVRGWVSDLTAGGALAAVVVPLLAARDPGARE